MLYSPSWNFVYSIHTKVLVGDWLKGISYSKLSHRMEGWGEVCWGGYTWAGMLCVPTGYKMTRCRLSLYSAHIYSPESKDAVFSLCHLATKTGTSALAVSPCHEGNIYCCVSGSRLNTHWLHDIVPVITLIFNRVCLPLFDMRGEQLNIAVAILQFIVTLL